MLFELLLLIYLGDCKDRKKQNSTQYLLFVIFL